MSPRSRCLVLALLPALALAAPAAADDDNSWVGKTVLKKKGDVKLRRMDDDGKIVFEARLMLIDYKVLREEGRWVRVRDRGEEGWVAKADIVRLEDAVNYFTDRIRADSRDGDAYGRRAAAWKLRGELDIAIKDCDEAIRLEPKEATWWAGRGGVWFLKRECDKSIKDYDEAIRIEPKMALLFSNRGVAWKRKNDYDKALRDYDEAIRIDARYPDPFNGRAWILATCPDGGYRDGKKATEAAKRACELTDWKHWDYLDTLAAAYAEARDFEKAVAEQEKALADKSLTKDDRAEMEKRLALYRQKKPYRDED